MNNKDILNFMDQQGGINEIKINGLSNMLDSDNDNNLTTSAYTSSILDLFINSDSEYSYESEGGKGKKKIKKIKKSKKSKKKKSKSKTSSEKSDKSKKSNKSDKSDNSDTDSLLKHIKSDKTVDSTSSEPIGKSNLSNLALLGTNLLSQPTQQNSLIPVISNSQQTIPQLTSQIIGSLAGLLAQQQITQLQTVQITKEQAQILVPLLEQLKSKFNL